MRGLSLLLGIPTLALLLAGCGGGGGGAAPDSTAFVTADPRGVTAPTDGGALASLPDMGGAANEAAGDLAREIEEADLVRVDGNRLFLLNAWRGLVVVDLPAMQVLGRLPIDGVPHEAFLRAARAFVFVGGYEGGSRLLEVDCSNPAAPTLLATFPLGGAYRTSRLVGSTLVAVTDEKVLQFDASGPLAAAGSATLPRGAWFVHATDGLLAVAAPGDGLGTVVTLVSFGSPPAPPAVRGSLTVAGWVADDEKLHIGAGTLRIVAHDFADGGLSRLTTVSLADLDAPTVLGTLELARGEQLFATRFSDDLAYIVTFEQVDPLWVVDLSDPARPTVAGSLETPGWSTHLVPVPGRLVALGVDPSNGWSVIVSLFDVTDPAAPALLDREDFGWGWSAAFEDLKGFGVFPSDGLVLVPFAGEADRLAVLDLSASSLALRGQVDLDGAVLRGVPHALGIVAVSTEEVVRVDRASLAVLGRATIAENVVDAVRLADGSTLPLVAKRSSGRLGDVVLPMVPQRCWPHGDAVAVTGWDGEGRCCFVVDFGPPTPTVSARLELGGGGFMLGYGPPGMAWADGRPAGPSGGGDAVLTSGGLLVVHGLPWEGGPPPGGGPDGGWGPGPRPMAADGAADGFVVVDVAAGQLAPRILVEEGLVTGFAADGEALLYTAGRFHHGDREGRPWMRHDLVRVDLATRSETAPANVPGWVVAAEGGRAYLAQESWGEGWTCEVALVALDLSGAAPAVLDELALPDGAFDLRAAGATLFFTAYEGGGPPPPGPLPPDFGFDGLSGVGVARPVWDDGGVVAPTVRVGTVRLGATLAEGPSIRGDGGFVSLLLPEDGAAVVVRDGATVERRLVDGAVDALDWSVSPGAYPLAARAAPGDAQWLLALGYGGLAIAP